MIQIIQQQSLIDFMIQGGIFIGGSIVIFIGQYLLLQLIKRNISKMDKISLDIINGVNILIKFFSLTLVLYLFLIVFDNNLEDVILVSSILGAILSFGSAQAIQNFIAGLYIVLTSPFGIKDFIALDDKEGLVIEISLNYTKLRSIDNVYHYIPNKKILGANIINYNNRFLTEDVSNTKIGTIKKLIGDEILRYTFIWGAPIGDYSIIKQKIDEICDKYSDKFGYKPEYFLFDVSHRLQFKFIVKVNDSENERLIEHLTNFRDEIALKFH